MRNKKVEIQAYFQEVFEPELKDRGFLLKSGKNGHYYRKNGNTFQAIGLDCSSRGTTLRLEVFPYWTDRLDNEFHSRDISVYSYKTRGWNWIDSGFDSKEYGDELDYYEMDLSRTIQIYREKYLPALDAIRDEESFCSHYQQIDRYFGAFNLQASVLWLSYQKGTLDFAKKWVQETRDQQFELSRQRLQKEKEEQERYEKMLQDPSGTGGDLGLLMYFMQQKLNFSMQKTVQSPINVEEAARESADRVMQLHAELLLQIIQDDDLEWIKQKHDEEAPVMRDFFLRNFGLDFSE